MDESSQIQSLISHLAHVVYAEEREPIVLAPYMLYPLYENSNNGANFDIGGMFGIETFRALRRKTIVLLKEDTPKCWSEFIQKETLEVNNESTALNSKL